MTTHRILTGHRAGALAVLGAAGASAQAQTCNYTIVSAAGPVAAVPSLTMLGLALMAGAVAWLAWRRGKFPGARLMATALVMAAAVLANQGGGGLVQRAYAAAVSLTDPAGESMTITVTDGEPITFTNNAGAPLAISSVSPALPGCDDGATLAAGASCVGTASCPAPMCVNANESANPASPTGCACDPGYLREPNGQCSPDGGQCPNGSIFNGYELVCAP